MATHYRQPLGGGTSKLSEFFLQQVLKFMHKMDTAVSHCRQLLDGATRLSRYRLRPEPTSTRRVDSGGALYTQLQQKAMTKQSRFYLLQEPRLIRRRVDQTVIGFEAWICLGSV